MPPYPVHNRFPFQTMAKNSCRKRLIFQWAFQVGTESVFLAHSQRRRAFGQYIRLFQLSWQTSSKNNGFSIFTKMLIVHCKILSIHTFSRIFFHLSFHFLLQSSKTYNAEGFAFEPNAAWFGYETDNLTSLRGYFTVLGLATLLRAIQMNQTYVDIRLRAWTTTFSTSP